MRLFEACDNRMHTRMNPWFLAGNEGIRALRDLLRTSQMNLYRVLAHLSAGEGHPCRWQVKDALRLVLHVIVQRRPKSRVLLSAELAYGLGF